MIIVVLAQTDPYLVWHAISASLTIAAIFTSFDFKTIEFLTKKGDKLV